MSGIPQSEVASLEVYYTAGRCLERSTFGAMLEHHRMLAFGSNGRRHRQNKRSWWWRPGDYTSGASVVRRWDAPAPPMSIAKPNHGEPSYTPEDRLLEAYGAASRRMLAVERTRTEEDRRRAAVAREKGEAYEPTGARASRVLEAYYGDRGRRWEWYAVDRVIDGSTVRGCGPGAIAAVFCLTARGREFIRKERERVAERAAVAAKGKKAKRAPVAQTDDELLSAVYATLRQQPDIARGALLNRVRDEAEALLLEAQRVWVSTAPKPERGTGYDPRGRARAWHDEQGIKQATVAP